MKNSFIIVKFGDLVLKGKNIKIFIDTLFLHVKNAIGSLTTKIEKTHSWFVVYYKDNEDIIFDRLSKIPGIYSFYKVSSFPLDLESLSMHVAKHLNESRSKEDFSFKIETKRIDKSYELTSLEFSKKIASMTLRSLRSKPIIDVHNPQVTLFFQINKEDIYFHTTRDVKYGLGGFPYGLGGKALVMLSGGIDSPVSAFLAMKQGMNVELFHFDSTPLTPLESIQKVIDISKQIAQYSINRKVKLHVVSINKLHQEILSNVKDSYIITILRRMMYRLASIYVKKNKFNCIINGESLGQVASQTIESIRTISNVCDEVILRPLVTYDKNDIIKISRKINTFDISIRSFNDCCSIYVPKAPAIKPTIEASLHEESKFDYEPYLSEIIENIKTIVITPEMDLNICDYGFDFNEAINNYEKDNK